MSNFADMTYKTMERRIKVRSYGDAQRIRFLGDIHLSSDNCDRDLLRRVADRWRADNDNAIYCLMGDINDFASFSERNILGGGLHESTQKTLDKLAAEQIDEFVEMFDFIIGKTAFVIEGNHKWSFVTEYPGATSDQVLAAKLGATWGGALCHCRITYRSQSKGKTACVVIAAHHGKAGGKRIGAAFNQIEDMAMVLDADVYAMGHNHRADSLHGFERLGLKKARRPEQDVVEDIGCIAKAPLYVRTGSFLQAYPSGQASYVASRILPPAALGAMEVEVELRRVRTEGEDAIRPVLQGRIIR